MDDDTGTYSDEYSDEFIRQDNVTPFYPSVKDSNIQGKLNIHSEFENYKYDKEFYINNNDLSKEEQYEQIKELSNNKCSGSGGYIYKNIQLFISSFISLNTPYNGVLLYHGVGVGKTCSSILIANNFKEYVRKNNKKVIILTKGAVQTSFNNEIFDGMFENTKVDKNSFKCTSNEYSEDFESYKNDNNEHKPTESISTENETKYANAFNKNIVKEYYEIWGYQAFYNEYHPRIIDKHTQEYDKDKIDNIFSNCIFIIDEVHNLRDENTETDPDIPIVEEKEQKKDKKDSKKDYKLSRLIIENIIKKLSNPIKLILLSATPMYDKYEEFQFIIDLLLYNDYKNHNKDNNLYKPFIEEKEEPYKNAFDIFVNQEKSEFYNEVKEIILLKTRGYISYIKGNDPLIFPNILYPTDLDNFHYLHVEKNIEGDVYDVTTPVVLCAMSNLQNKMYVNCPTKEYNKKKQYNNLILPNKTKDTLYTFLELFKEDKSKNNYSLIKSAKESVKELITNIKNYSTKLFNLMENLGDNINEINGKIFIYSEFVDVKYGGNNFVPLLLEAAGFKRKTVKKDKIIVDSLYNLPEDLINKRYKGDDELYYIKIDSNITEKHLELLKTEFNSSNNKNGNSIKIILGTMMIAEGVSLFNIREIHILDFWYNISRNQQLIGRGIRQCSHKTLDFEHRNLTIYNYIAVTQNIETEDNDKLKLIKYIKKQSDYPIDIRKLQLSHEKYEKILKIENLIKQNSIDCLLNKNVNNTTYDTYDIDDTNISSKIVFEIKNSKNESKLINYSLNDDIKCINEEFSENTPTKIKDINKYFINNNSIVNIKYHIKLIYRKTNKIYLDFDTIKDYIKKFPIYSKYNESNLKNLIRVSLHELIFNRELFYNKFNNKGFLIINGKYFIFKLFDTNEIELPYEILINPFKNKLKHIINFDKYSIKLSNMDKFTRVKTKTTRTKSSTKKISIDNENLQSICIRESITNLTRSKEFEDLWRLIIYSGKSKASINEIKNLLPSPSPRYIKLSTVKNILNISDKTFNFNEKFINNIYNDLNTVLFVYNSLELIVNYLKCLFYTVYIKQDELDEQNKVIYNYYKYLIINDDDPVIFKFINFIKMSNTESYDYTNKNPLQIVYYQFDTKDNEWYTHDTIKDNYDIENILVDIFSINLNVYKKKNDFIKTNISPNIDDIETHFMNIYNSFNYTEYNKKFEYNYFEYTGDYESPYDFTKIKPSNTIFLNMVGIIDIKPGKVNDQITEKNLSKIVFTLGIIYFQFTKIDTYPVYYRGNLGSIIKGDITVNHILYSVLDQVQELNKLILFNSIFYTFDKEEIYIIWNLLTKDNIPFKFLLKDNLNYSFDENYNLHYELTQDIFANLCELMTTNLIDDNFTNTYKEIFEKKIFTKPWDTIKIDIIEKLDIISNLNLEDSINSINENQNLMYKYIEEYKILIQNTSSTNLLTSSLLLSTLLYNLDKFKFYNKRWLLNLYESSFLTADILDLKFFTGKIRGQRLYDKTANIESLTKTKTLISSRALRS